MNTDKKIPPEVKKLFIERLISQGITNKKLLNVISSIPRHLFVESALSRRAYDDDALPIGYGQTISSPYILFNQLEAPKNLLIGFLMMDI